MRTYALERNTKETQIKMSLNIDGTGKGNISSGIGFFDHMLNSFAKHGNFDLDLECKGDLNVDCHHSVEDIGICLGKAFAQALGDKSGIARYGSAYVPMDEALAFCSLDISGRAFLVFDAKFSDDRIGEFDTCLAEEFFRAFAFNAGITLHIREEYGKNDHHICEAIFKAVAHALKQALAFNGGAVLSTKGVL
jgi:imidazoleglycerol-phosphate dehydratase